METLYAPFTAEQIQAINERQCLVESIGPFGHLHPLTCSYRGQTGHGNEAGDLGVLIATEQGMVCPYCGYLQEDIPAVMDLPPSPVLLEALSRIAPLDEIERVFSARLDEIIDAYRAYYRSKVMTRAAGTAEAKRIEHSLQTMLDCLNRRRLALKGVETRPGRDFSIDPSWISRTKELPPPGRHVEVLSFCDGIGNPLHPGYKNGYWTQTSHIIKEIEGCDIFMADLTETGQVTHWRELPDDVRERFERTVALEEVPYLHIYGQEASHDDARIVGNRVALARLRDALNAMLSPYGPDAPKDRYCTVYASDGEGYRVTVALCKGEEMVKMETPYEY